MALKFEKTKSTHDAMVILEGVHTKKLQQARAIAKQLCGEHGATHTRQVRDRMKQLGLLDGKPEYWLGAVFRTSEFVWTGQRVLPPSPNPDLSHEWRPVKVWKLAL